MEFAVDLLLNALAHMLDSALWRVVIVAWLLTIALGASGIERGRADDPDGSIVETLENRLEVDGAETEHHGERKA